MITSGGNRNPVNPDRGEGTELWRRCIIPPCPRRSSVNANSAKLRTGRYYRKPQRRGAGPRSDIPNIRSISSVPPASWTGPSPDTGSQ